MAAKSNLLLIAAAVLLAFSCGKEKAEDDLNPDKGKGAETGITTINVAEAVKKTMTLVLEEKAEVGVKWYPSAANVVSSSWETSDKSVVKLDYPRAADYTTVQALKEGKATITARIKDEDGNVRTAKTLITVVTDQSQAGLHFIEKIEFNVKTVDRVKAGNYFTIKAKITPADADYPELIWDVSDQSVLRAEPSSDGLECKVTVLKSGGAKVYAYSAYSKAYDECSVIAGSSPVTSLRLPEGTASMKMGEEGTFYVAWEPELASDTNFLWEVDSDYLEVVKMTKNSIVVRATGIGEGDFIKVSTQSGLVSATARVKCYANTVNAVDMGLSVLWGDKNIGADSEDDPGMYFAWGEVSGKKEFKDNNYKWYQSGVGYTKYCYAGVDGVKDGRTRLLPEDDIATRLGGKWRMPTLDEISELKEAARSSDYEVTFQKESKRITLTNLKNGNSLVFPFSGVRYDKSIDRLGQAAEFWTSDIAVKAGDPKYNRTSANIPEGSSGYAQHFNSYVEGSNYYGYFLSFDLYDSIYWTSRKWGMPVRPVCDK